MIILMPVAILLTLSFFVLVVVSKLADKSLKVFGWVICVVLWVSAALIAASAYTFSTSGAYGGYGRTRGICPLPGSRARQSDTYHQWKNKPYHQGMYTDPHHGFMMEDADNPMAGLEEDLRCPVAEGDMPAQEPAAEPDTKK